MRWRPAFAAVSGRRVTIMRKTHSRFTIVMAAIGVIAPAACGTTSGTASTSPTVSRESPSPTSRSSSPSPTQGEPTSPDRAGVRAEDHPRPCWGRHRRGGRLHRVHQPRPHNLPHCRLAHGGRRDPGGKIYFSIPGTAWNYVWWLAICAAHTSAAKARCLGVRRCRCRRPIRQHDDSLPHLPAAPRPPAGHRPQPLGRQVHARKAGRLPPATTSRPSSAGWPATIVCRLKIGLGPDDLHSSRDVRRLACTR
jgi:hypothetical protein